MYDDIPIDRLHLTTGAIKKLKRAGITTIQNLIDFKGDPYDFMGDSTIALISATLKKQTGLEWKPIYFLSELGSIKCNQAILKKLGITPKRDCNRRLYILPEDYEKILNLPL